MFFLRCPFSDAPNKKKIVTIVYYFICHWMRNLARARVINWQSKFGLFKSGARANERKKKSYTPIWVQRSDRTVSVSTKKSLAYYLLYIHLQVKMYLDVRTRKCLFIWLVINLTRSFKNISRARDVCLTKLFICLSVWAVSAKWTMRPCGHIIRILAVCMIW